MTQQYRDRDVRIAIQTALMATGFFDDVMLTGIPEDYGVGTSRAAACAIEPMDSRQNDWADGTDDTILTVDSRVMLTFLFRFSDPQIRDESVENLLEAAAKALNGQVLQPGLLVPDHSRFASWKFLPPAAPERRIQAIFTYQYLVFGWDDFSTAE